MCVILKGAQDADPLELLPHDLLVNSRECIREVMQLVLGTIREARLASIVTKEDIDVVREKLALDDDDTRYSVIVHFNELKTSQEFATALNKAHPAIAVSDWCFWRLATLKRAANGVRCELGSTKCSRSSERRRRRSRASCAQKRLERRRWS